LKGIESLLEEFSNDDLFSEYYFVGGTALAYYLNHRISYDIDFVTLKKLNVSRLKTLSVLYDAKYVPDKEASIFRINTGEDLENYKMSFNFNAIKVDFFYPNDLLRISIIKKAQANKEQIYQNINILPLETIADLKVLALLRRSKIRDLFDIYVLLEKDIIGVDLIERYMALENQVLTFPEFIEDFKDDGSESLDFSEENSYFHTFKEISIDKREAYIKEKIIALFVIKALKKESK
jgi:predicted nucleotidyltransferase component of viral defense system